MTADGVRLAGWWWRVLAAVLDSLIISMVATVLAFPIWQPVYAAFVDQLQAILNAQRSGAPPPPIFDPTALVPLRAQVILTGISLVIGLLYHVTFLRWKGATPGKLACGLRVVPVDRGRYSGRLDWTTVGIRSAIWVLPGMNALLGLFRVVDAIFPLWHAKRQALHDLAAKTQVVRPGPVIARPAASNFR
jgi:uncharacterized RDD family membrane protein YckC